MPSTRKSIAVLECGDAPDFFAAWDRAFAAVHARLTVTTHLATAIAADGLLLASRCPLQDFMSALKHSRGDEIIHQRLLAGRPVLACNTGMQALFDVAITSTNDTTPEVVNGLGQWSGSVELLHPAGRMNHGEAEVLVPSFSRGGRSQSAMFAGLDAQALFSFWHDSAARRWDEVLSARGKPPIVGFSHASDDGKRFVSAVEAGVLWATQFDPERSGAAGHRLLHNWVSAL